MESSCPIIAITVWRKYADSCCREDNYPSFHLIKKKTIYLLGFNVSKSSQSITDFTPNLEKGKLLSTKGYLNIYNSWLYRIIKLKVSLL